MNIVDSWSGRKACCLQAAFRMSNEGFAGHLGVAVRTVAAWHSKPELVPKPEMQQILDAALEGSTVEKAKRFETILKAVDVNVIAGSRQISNAHVLQVAVAVVVKENDVLLVHRREDVKGINWQFPAGIVKPGNLPGKVAISETLAETGIHCSVREQIGDRLHPKTEVHCLYFMCDYLTGEVANNDPIENISVIWVPLNRLTNFVPKQAIYPPVMEALEDRS